LYKLKTLIISLKEKLEIERYKKKKTIKNKKRNKGVVDEAMLQRLIYNRCA